MTCVPKVILLPRCHMGATDNYHEAATAEEPLSEALDNRSITRARLPGVNVTA